MEMRIWTVTDPTLVVLRVCKEVKNFEKGGIKTMENRGIGGAPHQIHLTLVVVQDPGVAV